MCQLAEGFVIVDLKQGPGVPQPLVSLVYDLKLKTRRVTRRCFVPHYSNARLNGWYLLRLPLPPFPWPAYVRET